VGHRLERHVVESLLAAFADHSTRQLLAGAEPTVVARLSAELEVVDAQLAELARRWGRGEISRGEWDAAREGLASRGQDLRNRLGVLALPAFNADDVAGPLGRDRPGRASSRSGPGLRTHRSPTGHDQGLRPGADQADVAQPRSGGVSDGAAGDAGSTL
jgi:hypothetical protein